MVELLGVVVFGVDCEFGVVEVPLLGVVSVLFGVVVVPVDEVEPGVMVLPVELLPVVPVVSVFEDCGTAEPLAGTQSAVAVVEEPGVVLAVELGDVDELLLGEVLLEVDGEVLLELLGIVLLVELLGVVVLVEEFPLAVVVLVEPGALALVRGTIPAGQLLVEDALGVLVEGVVLLVPVCDDVVSVELPVWDEVEVDGDVVVVLVVDDVCAATHVALAVRTKSNVHFFMFSVLVKSSGYRLRCPFLRAGALASGQKDGPAWADPWLILDITYGVCDGTRHRGPSSLRPEESAAVAETPFAAFRSRW